MTSIRLKPGVRATKIFWLECLFRCQIRIDFPVSRLGPSYCRRAHTICSPVRKFGPRIVEKHPSFPLKQSTACAALGNRTAVETCGEIHDGCGVNGGRRRGSRRRNCGERPRRRGLRIQLRDRWLFLSHTSRRSPRVFSFATSGTERAHDEKGTGEG